MRPFDRRRFVIGAAAVVLSRPGGGFAQTAHAAEARPIMDVVKTPSCGCCQVWIDMAKASGFDVRVTETTDYAGMKRDAGVPRRLVSCHTARIEGYVVEGHVPFSAIRTLLRDRPDIAGISVPGMPPDSPGMGGRIDALVPVTAWGGVAGKGAPFEFTAR